MMCLANLMKIDVLFYSDEKGNKSVHFILVNNDGTACIYFVNKRFVVKENDIVNDVSIKFGSFFLSFTCRSPHHFLNDVLKFALLTPFSFTGWIGASLSRSPGGGSNYLCLPRNPKYSPVVDKSENENRAKLYGVEFQFAENIFKDTVSGEHDYYDAACAACKIRGRDSKIMIPGHIQCPKNWVLEYRGYLMAQETHLPRTEYICVDETPEFINGTERLSQGAGLLHFVETACGALPCRRVGPYYKKHYELSCVVCSSWELQPWDEELVILWFTLFLGRMRTELNSSIAQDLIMPRWITVNRWALVCLQCIPKR